MSTRANECQECGKVDEERVRQCCTWEGNRTVCPSCYLGGKGRTPGHVCGIGIERRVEDYYGED